MGYRKFDCKVGLHSPIYPCVYVLMIYHILEPSLLKVILFNYICILLLKFFDYDYDLSDKTFFMIYCIPNTDTKLNSPPHTHTSYAGTYS